MSYETYRYKSFWFHLTGSQTCSGMPGSQGLQASAPMSPSRVWPVILALATITSFPADCRSSAPGPTGAPAPASASRGGFISISNSTFVDYSCHEYVFTGFDR